MPWHERPAVRVRDENRTPACLERVKGRAIAAVRHVHGHPRLVHALDDGHAEVRQALVTALGRAIADQIPCVVGELGHALAQPVEQIDIVGRPKMFGVLDSEQDADAPGRLHAIQIDGAVDSQERLILIRQKRVPRSDELQRLRMGIGTTRADGDVEDVDPRRPEWPEIIGRERVRIRHPAAELREVQRQRAEHVDDRRPPNQVDGARGILFRARGQEPVPPAAHDGNASRVQADAA